MKAISDYRPYLFSISYNILGSVSEAEDIVQDSYLKWELLEHERIQTPRAYLARMVANQSLDRLKKLREERLKYIGPWLPEPRLQQPDLFHSSSDRKFELSIGFMMLLEKLTPEERVVFVLREVFDFPYPAIAEIVDHHEPYCRQLLRRARQHLEGKKKRFATTPTQLQMLINAFQKVNDSGSITPFIELLKEDVTTYSDGGGKVKAVLKPIKGKANCSRFFTGLFNHFKEQLSGNLVISNGCPSIVQYVNGKLEGIMTFEIEGDQIGNIYVVRNPDKIRHLISDTGSDK